MKIKHCLRCDKEIKTYPSDIKMGAGKYCSRTCKLIYGRERVMVNCAVCNIAFNVVPSALKRRRCCSKPCLNTYQLGSSGHWLGKKRPDLKHTAAAKTMFKSEDVRGENNKNWQGGLTKINYSLRHSWEYREWRLRVLTRDNNKCQWCGSQDELTVDHIKPFSTHPELRMEDSNGRTLCRSCHIKTDTWGGRAPRKGVVHYA